MMHILIMSKHVIKSLSKFVSNLFDLELLSVDFILNVVNSLVKLGDVHLSILVPSLGGFELQLDAQDLLLELFLNSLEFILCHLCSLNGSLELFLLDSKFS